MKFTTKRKNKFGIPYIRLQINDKWRFKLDVNEGGRWFVFNIWLTQSKKFFIYIAIYVPVFKKWFRRYKEINLRRII
jgi:hypothetical protein